MRAASSVRSIASDRLLTRPGFFYVTGHGLDVKYMQSLLKRGHDFFELPQEVKDSIHIFKSMDGVRGYQKLGENVTYAKRDQQEVCAAAPIVKLRLIAAGVGYIS